METTGGAILVYEIDAHGLTDKEKTGLSTRMIRTLQKRMDPDHIQSSWQVKSDETAFDNFGCLAVGFTLDEEGAGLFAELSSTNIGRPLCILLDGVAISAPLVQSRINARGVITGRFTQMETERIAHLLCAGGLPAKLNEEPTSIEIIGPIVKH
jgi:preprotein translocase subunit SecD